MKRLIKQMARRVFLPLNAALCTLPALWSQSAYPISAIPAELIPNAATVVREDLTTININSVEKATVDYRQVLSYLRQPSDNEIVLILPENRFFTVRSMHMTVYDASGKLMRENDRSEIQEIGNPESHTFSDTRYRVLKMVAPEAPFTVELSYKLDCQGFFPMPVWVFQSIGQSVEHAALTIKCPDDYKFQWRGVRTEIQATFTEKDRSWHWEARRLAALAGEKNHPYFKDQYAYLILAPEIFRMDGFEGSQQNWQRFGQFVFQLNAKRDGISPELAARVRKMTDTCRTERGKIAVLYRFMQENTRYVSVQIGIGGWQTFEASYVEKKGYGDCKALSNYMKALLNAAGIPSCLALAYAGEEGAPDLTSDLPDIRFNHMLLYVPSSDLWLECTSNDLPPGYLGAWAGNRKALILTPEGGRLATTPQMDTTANRINFCYEMNLQESGGATLEGRGTLRGAPHEWYRYVSKNVGETDRRRMFTQRAGYSILRLDRLDIVPAPTEPLTNVSYQLEIPNYATKTGRRLFVPLAKLAPCSRVLEPDTNRQLRFAQPEALCLNDTMRVTLSAGYAFENVPQNDEIQSEFGSYRRTLFAEPGKLTVVRQVIYLPLNVAAGQYEAVRQFYAQIAQAEGRQVVLVRQGP